MARDLGSEGPSAPLDLPPKIPGSVGSRSDISLVDVQDALDQRPPTQRLTDNLDAIELTLKLRTENRKATALEQAVLAKFSGVGDSDFGYIFETFRPYGRSQVPLWERVQAIKKALPEAEWNLLKESMVNANYTTKPVIDAMWTGVRKLGIASLPRLRLLEPAGGIGRFLGLQPVDLVAKSERTAVEMETLSAEMMRHLYPRADIVAQRLENTNLPENYYDLAISNVPFSQVGVVDPSPKYQSARYSFLTKNLHNYYFAKALDKVRPGGVVAFITSRYSMDAKGGARFRQYLSEQADLLGAFRLPRDTFSDTSVSTDLLFLRKRLPNDPPGDTSWIDTKSYSVDYYGQLKEAAANAKDAQDLNPYWTKNPANVLGTWEFSRYRGGTIDVRGDSGTQFADLLNARIAATLPDGVIQPEVLSDGERTRVDPNAVRVPEGSYVVDPQGQLFVQKADKMVRYDASSPAAAERIKKLLGLRDLAQEVATLQKADGTEADLTQVQAKLRAAYWEIAKKYGPIHERENARLFRQDQGWGLTASIERWTDSIQDAVKRGDIAFRDDLKERVLNVMLMPITNTRLLRPREVATTAGDPAAALAISLNEKGAIDLNHMGQLTGLSPQDIIARLGSAIYENPQTGWEPAEEYLGGDVVGKLQAARYYAGQDARYARNVSALEDVQPPPIPFSQLTVQPTGIFVDPKIVDHFFYDLTGRDATGKANPQNVERLRLATPRANYNAKLGAWSFDTDRAWVNGPAHALFGTDRVTIPELFSNLMRGRTTKIYDTFGVRGIDERTVLNEAETNLAQDKTNLIKEEWKKFLYAHPAYMRQIEATYNQTLNRIKPKTYDGSKLTLPGSNRDITLRPHQTSTVWRVIREGRALIAHEPGFGKTYAMIASAMEMRRLGLSKRNLFVVPLNILGQWNRSFRDLYPTAQVLFPEKDDFAPANRTDFLNRIRTGDWDAVLITKEQLAMLAHRPETINNFFLEQIRQYQEAIDEVRSSGGGDRFTIKNIENRIRSMNTAMGKELLKAQKTKTNVFWEDLGVDTMFVDEAHHFKNLGFSSILERVKGMPNTSAPTALNMFLKTSELQRRRGGKGVVFATGTPMSNTIAENWTMQRYVQPDVLDEYGLSNFDAWAPTFGEVVADFEQQVNGEQRETNRFRYFNQVPELSKMFQQTADIRTSRDDPTIGDMKARIQGGERTVLAAPASDAFKEYMTQIDARLASFKGRYDKTVDNHLKVGVDARKASLDMRLIDPRLPDDPASKTNLAVETMARHYNELSDVKGTQLAFLDLGTPKATDDPEVARAESQNLVSLFTDFQTKMKQKYGDQYNPSPVPSDAWDAIVNEARTRGGVSVDYFADVLDPAQATQLMTSVKQGARLRPPEPARDVIPANPDVVTTDPTPPSDQLTSQEEGLRDSIYKTIRDKLVARGIPAREIAFAHEYATPDKRLKLTTAFNQGDVRILIGSRRMLSEGWNLQKRLGVLHNLDAPWTAALWEQGEARALRDGNEVFGPTGRFGDDGKFIVEDPGRGVKIYNYVTEESYDGVMWQAVETKARGIMEMMSREPTARSIVDIDPVVLDATSSRARVAKEPLYVETKKLETEIRKRDQRLGSEAEMTRRASEDLPRMRESAAQTERQIAAIQKDIALRDQAKGKTDFIATDKTKIGNPEQIKTYVGEKSKALDAQILKRPALGMDASLDNIPLGTFNGFRVLLRSRIAAASLALGKRFNEAGNPLETYAHSLALQSPDGPNRYSTSEFLSSDLGTADVATRLTNALDGIERRDLKSATDYLAKTQNDITGAMFRVGQNEKTNADTAMLGQMRRLQSRIRLHLGGSSRFDEAQSAQVMGLIDQLRKGQSPEIPPALVQMPEFTPQETAAVTKLASSMQRLTGNSVSSVTLREVIDEYRRGDYTAEMLSGIDFPTMTADEKLLAISYLDKAIGKEGGASPLPKGIEDNPGDIQYLQGGLGAVNLLTFIKEHPKAALATLAAGAVLYGAQARQDEQKTTGHVAEMLPGGWLGDTGNKILDYPIGKALLDIPIVQHTLHAGNGGVQVGDLVRGLNEYNTKDLPVMAELAARVAEIPVAKLAVVLGANKSNVDPAHSFFDVLQPAGFQGMNLSSWNETVVALQKSWAKREQHNPTLAFLMSLPADPMNYLGWGEGKVAAKAFEKAGTPLLKESIITAEDYEKARNPINQASGHWWSNISRAATSKNIAQEFGRIAYRAASVTGDPVTALERIDKAVRAGTATIEQKRLAYLWGETHTIDAPAVEDLASRMGVEKPGTGSLITPELVQQIRDRLRTKSKFNADDLQFLSKAFDFPTQPFGRRKLRNISRLQEWAAKYGAPDLASAIEQVDRLNPEEFRVQTTFRAREAFPTKQSPLSAWLEQYPLTMGAMATYNFAKPGVQALSHAVGLPLVLSFLMSPGWTLHAAVENTLRGYRGSLAEMPGILRGKVGTTPWYHDIDGTRRVLGHYYPSDVLLGRGGLVQAPFGDNSLTNSKFWPIGGAFNKWAAEGIRAGARAGQPPQVSRLAEMRRIAAEAAAKGQTPDQQAIKLALSTKPTGAMSQALEAFANVVEHSSLAHVYGANQWAVGKFEGLMRTYWIAGEHAKVYDAVVSMLGKEAVAADTQLRDLLKMPKGVDPATWERIQAASAAVLHKPGALADVVEGEIRGTIDRLNLAKSTFLEKDIPYPVQAEWYQAMRHATPEELSALFAPGGGAETMLDAGLEFMYGNRIRPMLDEILSNNAFDLTTAAGQREAWTALDSSLEASLTAHRDLWKWTHAVGYTMDTPEKSALFAEVRKTRQDWLALQKAEVGNARRMFENEIRKAKGISTVPNEVFDLQDQAFDRLMATYAESDRLITEYWAKIVGGAKQEKGVYQGVVKAQSEEWAKYRAFRNDIENKKNALIEDHYARNRAGSPKGPVAMVPLTGGQDVTAAQKAASRAALERVRGNLSAFTQRATVGQGQADALRQWVRDTEGKVSALPKPVLDQIEDAHTRTARIVMERMKNHFVDHLNTTEAGEFLRGFIPFFMYDANGGIFYLWMAQHMPGFYTDIARLEQQSGGTGYLAGGLNPVDVKGSPLESIIPAEDFGIFGNKIGLMRGLWPNRVLVFQKTLERNQPKSVQDFLQQELKAMPQQGLLGMHPSPLIEGPMALATGVMPNLPPPVTMATDVSAATGHGFGLPLVGEIRAHDPFLQANIKMELAGKGIDPDQATPEQLRIAEHNVSIRDFAQSAVPRFTYTAPEKLAEQQDFQNELARLGFSKQDQADWKARGFSPWALLDAQQKRTLMAAHPDWSYIFEAADAFKTPEEQQAARDTRTYLRAMTQITNDKMAAQVLDDAKLKKKSPDFTPKDWRTAHAKRNNIVAGRRLQAGIDFGNGKTAVQAAALNKILTPQDKAVRDYYTGYSQAIIDATDPTNSNVINWQEVNQKRKAYLASLPPAIGQYVNEEITKNETDVEKSFYASLDLLDQYQAIPRWIGVPPAVAADRSKKEALYARMRLVDQRGAAAYRIANPIISRRLPTNPARAQFAAQHPLLELWWIPPSVKRMSATDLNLVQFGEPTIVDWQVSPPGGTAPPPAPPQQGQPQAPALAAAGG